jgi:hypothetical protein
LEHIRDTLHEVNNLQSKVKEDTGEISRTMETIHETLVEIQDTNRQVNIEQAKKLDSLLAALQSNLPASLKRERPRTKGWRFKIAAAAESAKISRIIIQHQAATGLAVEGENPPNAIQISAMSPFEVTQVVETVAIARCRRGNAVLELVAVPDEDFKRASLETKIQIVKYL